MLFAALVVEQRPVLREFCNELDVDPVGAGPGRRGGVEHVQRDARVAVGVSRDSCERLVVGVQFQCAESALAIPQRAAEDRHHRLDAKRFQHVHFGSRQQRRVHFERGILSRGADEHDVARFNAGKKGILLCLVEPMDLVDEQDRPTSEAAPRFLSLSHDRTDFLDAGHDGAEGDEVRAGDVRDQACQRRFAGPWRAPQDD